MNCVGSVILYFYVEVLLDHCSSDGDAYTYWFV